MGTCSCNLLQRLGVVGGVRMGMGVGVGVGVGVGAEVAVEVAMEVEVEVEVEAEVEAEIPRSRLGSRTRQRSKLTDGSPIYIIMPFQWIIVSFWLFTGEVHQKDLMAALYERGDQEAGVN
jgi:hypothetical protein